MDKNLETFVTLVTFLKLVLKVYPDRKAQIASLLTKDIKILNKYLDFANVVLEEKALMLLEGNKLNEHTINLEKDKHSSYGPIYNLGPIALKTLKTYIKTYLKTELIRSSKSLAGALIFFKKKLDNSFCLYIDYRSLNNLIIKNQYPLSLIDKWLNQRGQAKRFTQLVLTSTDHRMRIKEGNE